METPRIEKAESKLLSAFSMRLTFGRKTSIMVLRPKLGGETLTEKNKGGRPTDEPKPHRLSTRVSDETFHILDDYCKKRKINHPEGVRQAINRLKDEK